MKKLLKLITMLFLASALVISCGGGSGSDVPSTSDCTETVSTLELSDGEWTVYMNQTALFIADERTLEATVTNGAYEFTSGEGSSTVDMEKLFSLMGEEEAIEAFKAMSDEEKNAMLESMDIEISEGYDVSWDGLTLNIEGTLSAEELAEMHDLLDLEAMPDDAVIKTNADKTKYTISFEIGGTEVEIIAVKNN